MLIPNHVANFSIFKDGRRLIGLADVTLSNLQNLTDELKGSGIFGAIDMPVQAHFQSATVTLKWLTIDDDAVFATLQDGASLHAWAAIQQHDSGTNRILHAGWRFIMGTAPKSFNLGKLEVGTKGELESEYELINLRILNQDRVMVEIDKENAICRWFDGFTLVDNAAAIRQQIGL
jgi:Bacteriophage tail tube protein